MKSKGKKKSVKPLTYEPIDEVCLSIPISGILRAMFEQYERRLRAKRILLGKIAKKRARIRGKKSN